jgi:hypothetical protein
MEQRELQEQIEKEKDKSVALDMSKFAINEQIRFMNNEKKAKFSKIDINKKTF